jgi:hypothetical protein
MDSYAGDGICSDLSFSLGGNRRVKSVKTNWPLTVLLVISAPIWLPLIILLLLLLAILVPFSYLLLYLSIWSFWLTRGKDILFVYSDSPIWRDYMLSEVLPLMETRAVVLNWSERSTWKRWSLRVLAFRFFGGRKAFNPLIVVFRPLRLARKFRFWPAFREWKQGNKQAVEKLKLEIAQTLALPS